MKQQSELIAKTKWEDRLILVLGLLLLIFICLACLSPLLTISPFIILAWQDGQNLRRYNASSLPVEMIQDLCDRDLVPVEISDCMEIEEFTLVKGDLPGIINHNLNVGVSTLDDVKYVFGEPTYCESSESRFSCYYQKGFVAVFEFTDANILTRFTL